MGYNDGFLDDIICESLKKRKKVELFLCRDKEGGFGIKINGIEVERNLPWECFELEIKEDKYDKIIERLCLTKTKQGGKG